MVANPTIAISFLPNSTYRGDLMGRSYPIPSYFPMGNPGARPWG